VCVRGWGAGETHAKHSHDTRAPGQESNPGYAKYEGGMLCKMLYEIL